MGGNDMSKPIALSQYQSIRWDMDILLEDLIEHNDICKIDREYKAHKYDDCFHGYCMYLKHPTSDTYSLMIGIWEDGFTYLGDGENNNLQFENTINILEEMFFYGEWVKAKERNLNDCTRQIL
jgi:hypothetical protein